MQNRLAKLWRSLPCDGQGLFPPSDTDLAGLRRQMARRFWWRVPGWSRPLLIPAARLFWGGAALVLSGRFVRVRPMGPSEVLSLFVDCLRSGAGPTDAWVWRRLFPQSPIHPLPGRAAALLLPALGDPAQHRLLADKLATAALLTKAGLAVPRPLAEIGLGAAFDPFAPHWSKPGRLFVKPRHGAAGRGAMVLDVIAPGLYRIGGGAPIGSDILGRRLDAGATRDSLMIQEWQDHHPDLADLAAAGAPPVLRLNIARLPGNPPFLHSALLSVAVPGEPPRDFLRGHLQVALDSASGRMARGLHFFAPGERYERLPWNGAALTGRVPPGFDRAAEMALQATALFPGLALINWDVILTPGGPVILEGNSCGNWILTRLASIEGLETQPLAPLLQVWAETHEAQYGT